MVPLCSISPRSWGGVSYPSQSHWQGNGNTQQNLALPASKKGGGLWGHGCQGGCVLRPELASVGGEADIQTQWTNCTPQCGPGYPAAWLAKGARGDGTGPGARESWSPTLPLPPGAPQEPRPGPPSDAGLIKGSVLTSVFPVQTVAVLISRTTARGMEPVPAGWPRAFVSHNGEEMKPEGVFLP